MRKIKFHDYVTEEYERVDDRQILEHRQTDENCKTNASQKKQTLNYDCLSPKGKRVSQRRAAQKILFEEMPWMKECFLEFAKHGSSKSVY